MFFKTYILDIIKYDLSPLMTIYYYFIAVNIFQLNSLLLLLTYSWHIILNYSKSFFILQYSKRGQQIALYKSSFLALKLFYENYQRFSYLYIIIEYLNRYLFFERQ